MRTTETRDRIAALKREADAADENYERLIHTLGYDHPETQAAMRLAESLYNDWAEWYYDVQ